MSRTKSGDGNGVVGYGVQVYKIWRLWHVGLTSDELGLTEKAGGQVDESSESYVRSHIITYSRKRHHRLYKVIPAGPTVAGGKGVNQSAVDPGGVL